MSGQAVPVYYELSWAILSTIGLTNVGFGLMVVGIAGFSPIALVPIIVSAAGAIANGLCYYSFYAINPVTNTAVASGVADLSWLIQEAGLSFYSYVILRRVLGSRSRIVFMTLFWVLMALITALRVVILVSRVRYILGHSTAEDLQSTIDKLHVGYFSSIALVECVSAAFLLHTFHAARRISMRAAIQSGLFSYLMRSTEIRLALLALIGITRAVTYSFQSTAQSATTVASQMDRFAYTLECVFPMIMIIDILASRLIYTSRTQNRTYGESSQSRAAAPRKFEQHIDGDVQLYPMPNVSRHIEAEGGQTDRSSSQEHIIEGGVSSRVCTNSESDEAAVSGPGRRGAGGGITKIVEFQVFEVRQ